MADLADVSGRYLFAATRGIDAHALEGSVGLRGAPLEIVGHRGLQAVVCTVDLADFGEQALARNLEDMAWVEEVARRHNDVVFAVATHGTVAPMRLVTICASDDSVRQRIEESYDALCASLDRVEGRREWSVKAYAARTEAVPESAGATSGPGAGAAYLQRKRDQADRRRMAGERSVQMAEEIHEIVNKVAVASRRLAPQDPRLSGRSEPMILNAAYLVPIEEGDDFRAAVQRIAEQHLDVGVEVDGPWPPYSFATLE